MSQNFANTNRCPAGTHHQSRHNEIHSFLTVLKSLRQSFKPQLNAFKFFFFFSQRNSEAVDYEEGILQTIGFKEFIPYLEKFDNSHDILINRFAEAPETTPEPDGWKALASCLEELKNVTKRYSKRQVKWIRNRFLGSDMREVPLVYPLDTSDVNRWSELVSRPAEQTVDEYINDNLITLKAMEKLKRLAEGTNEETSHHCATCDRVFIGEFQWQLHLQSNRHKRAIASKHKRERRLNENTSS